MMNSGTFTIKTIVAIGIGSAVFMILGRFASIPTGIPNTEIQTAYAFLALMAIICNRIHRSYIKGLNCIWIALVQLDSCISSCWFSNRTCMEKNKYQ